jgi:hypothetical protein
MFRPRKTTRAQVQYNDIAGLDSGVNRSGGLSPALLNAISINDALLHVVRAFRDETIPHMRGSVNPARDLRDLDAELILADLAVVERRLERLQRDLKRPGPTADLVKPEQELLLRLKGALESETPLRDMDLAAADQLRLRGFGFLTLKPVLVVLNVGDDGPLDSPAIVPYPHRHSALIALRGGIEREIAQMDEASAEPFLTEYGIGEPSLQRMIRLSYDLLGVQSFFTVGEDEVRAWTMPRGGTAVDAAGAIHTDLARGFIRAEVIGYEDLVRAGSLTEARQRGLLRLEGRDYVVKDGDVVEIRFNV